MNAVFWLLIIIGLGLVWLSLSFAFGGIGGIAKRLWKDASDAMGDAEAGYYCPKCNGFVSSHVEDRRQLAHFPDRDILVNAKARICNKCGDILFDRELDQIFMEKAYKLKKKEENEHE